MRWTGRCFVLALGVGASLTWAQEEPSEDAIEQLPQVVIVQRPASTKLEAFEQSQGALLTRGYTKIGNIGSDDGANVNIYTVVIADSNGNRLYGMAIEVINRDNEAAWTYIDEDEVKPLIDVLGPLGRVDKNSTPLDNTEARYRTRGGLQITNRDANGVRMIGLRAVAYLPLTGQMNWSRARFRVARLSEIERQLVLARDMMNRLKTDAGK